MSIRLVIVDDHPLILGGLEQLFRAEPDFEVLATCNTLAEGWTAVVRHTPDILLLDLRLSDGDGLSLARRLDPSKPPMLVVLTAVNDENVLLDAIRLGARGIVLKAMAPRLLETCVRAVYRGETWLTVNGVDLGGRLLRRQQIEAELEGSLTPREIEVMRLADLTLDNEAIARKLSISVGTVKIHLHHVFDKLQVSGRQDLQQFLRSKGY